MPDNIQPVGAMIQPPAPQNGLSSLSSILGIRQQQQNLQTGQYLQQTAQADAQQAQQKNGELQAAQTVIKNGVASGRYTKPDGSFDRIKAADDVNTVAPTYGGTVSNQLLSGANEVISNKQALQNLNQSQRAQVGGVIQGLAADPNVDNTKVIGAMKNLIKENPGDENIAQLVISNLTHMPSSGKSSDLQAALNTMASGLTGQPAIAGTTNAAGQIINRGTASGQLSPAGVVGQPSTSANGNGLNPTSTTVAGQTTAATTRAAATGNADVDRGNAVSAAVAPASKTILITKEIDDLADQVHSGKFAAIISKAAASAGQSSDTYARQLLEKDLGQLRTNATPASATDARQATVISGLPDASSDSQTIHTSMDYTRGVARQDLARGALLNQVKAKDSSLRGFQAADDTLTSSTDPLMHEFASLKTPADRTAFYKRNFSNAKDPVAAAQAFRNKVAGWQHVTGQ
jgi:hypothetical protein